MTANPLLDGTNAFGCVVHQGKRDKDGYGMLPNGQRAHIAAWTEANGAVPDGMVADHLCCNRACSRLSHIQIVTQRENSFRKSIRYRLRIERCPRGHDLRLYGVVVPPSHPKGGNGRICRQCDKEMP